MIPAALGRGCSRYCSRTSDSCWRMNSDRDTPRSSAAGERSEDLDARELPLGELRHGHERNVEGLGEGLDEGARGAEPRVEDAVRAARIVEPAVAARAEVEGTVPAGGDAEERSADARERESATGEIRRWWRMRPGASSRRHRAPRSSSRRRGPGGG